MGNYDPPEPEKEPFAYTAAKFGIYAPIIAIALNGALAAQSSSSSATGPGVVIAKLIVSLLATACIAAGAVFAIIALCSTSRLGKEGLLGRGISGLVLNGILLALFAVAFVNGFTKGFTRAVHARETRQELREANNDLRSSLRNSFDAEKGITNVD